jgi:hypothetical protein
MVGMVYRKNMVKFCGILMMSITLLIFAIISVLLILGVFPVKAYFDKADRLFLHIILVSIILFTSLGFSYFVGTIGNLIGLKIISLTQKRKNEKI